MSPGKPSTKRQQQPLTKGSEADNRMSVALQKPVEPD
jgi:hypothetical protein